MKQYPIWIVAIFIAMFFVIFYYIPKSNLQAQKCLDNGLDEFCSSKEIECKLDCESLNNTLFKYKVSSGGMFGGVTKECYCNKNNTIQKIW